MKLIKSFNVFPQRKLKSSDKLGEKFFFSHGDDRISVVVKSVSHDCVTSYVTAVVYDVSDGHTCWCMCVNDVAEVFFLILK